MTLSEKHVSHAINNAVAKFVILKSRTFPQNSGFFDLIADFNAKSKVINVDVCLTTKRDSYDSMARDVLTFIQNTDWKTALSTHEEWLKGFKLKTTIPKKVADIIGTDELEDYCESEHSIGFSFQYTISDSALRTLERDYRKVIREKNKQPKYISSFNLKYRRSNERLISFDVANNTLTTQYKSSIEGYKVGDAVIPYLNNLSREYGCSRNLISHGYDLNNIQTSCCRTFVLQDQPCTYMFNMHTAIEIKVEREGRTFEILFTPFKTKKHAYKDSLDSIITDDIDLTNEIYNRARTAEINKIVKPCLVRGAKIVSVKTVSIKANTNFSAYASYRSIKVILEDKNRESSSFTIKRNGQIEFHELEHAPSNSSLKNQVTTKTTENLAELFCKDRSYVSELVREIYGCKDLIIMFC